MNDKKKLIIHLLFLVIVANIKRLRMSCNKTKVQGESKDAGHPILETNGKMK